MNSLYSLKVSFCLDVGNNEPLPEYVTALGEKVDMMAKLLFGDNVLAPCGIELCKDEEQDYTVYAEVNVVLHCHVNITAVDEMVANDIAANVFNEMEESIYLSNDNTGVELASANVSNINILNIELDSPRGEKG